MLAPFHFGRCVHAGAVWLAAGVLALLAPVQAAETYSEDAVEAAYLYRFSAYVEWPQADASRPFVITVLDAPAVAGELRRIVPGHLIHGRAIKVVETSRPSEVQDTSILYIGAGYADSLRGVSAALAAQSTLIVTNQEDGLTEGAALNFLTVDHRVRFEVSLSAAARSHLKISSDLLAVAVRVIGIVRQSHVGGRESRCGGRVGCRRLRRDVA